MSYHPIESEMEMFARVYSRDTGVKILFGKRPSTDGKNITIIKLPDSTDPWKKFMIEMFVYHETGHIITKDIDAFRAYINNGRRTHKSTIFNNLRDTTIEGQTMEIKWPGMKPKWKKFLTQLVDEKNVAMSLGLLKPFRMLMSGIYFRGRELQHDEKFGPGLILSDPIEEIFQRRIAKFLPDIAEHNTIAESQRLTEAIYDELMKEPPPPPPPPPPPQQSQSGDPQDESDDEDQDESGDDQGNSTPMPDVEEELDMPNEPEKEDEEDKGETISVPSDSDDEDENPDENDSENDKGTSEDSEDEEDTEDKDESEDGSESSESDENEPEDSEDDNSDPDDSDGNESEDNPDDSEDDESEDDESDPDDSDGDGSEDEEPFSEDAEEELKKTQQKMEDGDTDDGPDNIGEEITENVSKYADTTCLYREEAGLEERIIQCNPRHGWESEVAKFETAGRKMTGYTGTKLKILFISEKAPVTHRNLKEGKLDCRKLWKLKAGLTEICKRTHPASRQDSAVSIVVDNSLSMCGEKGNITHSIMTSLGADMEKMRIPFEAMGFTTQWVDQDDADALASNGIRTLPININLMKTFNEPYRTVRHRFVWPPNNIATAELPALIFATKRLLKRKETKKVLFLLTDGATCTGNQNLNAAMHTATIDYIKRMKRAGIRVVLIGIKDETVKDYDPNALIFKELDTFAGQFYKYLMSILL